MNKIKNNKILTASVAAAGSRCRAQGIYVSPQDVNKRCSVPTATITYCKPAAVKVLYGSRADLIIVEECYRA